MLSFMLKQLLFITCIVLPACSAAAQPNFPALPDALQVGNELVDAANNFAIRIDLPDVKWYVYLDNANTREYLGVDKLKQTMFRVSARKTSRSAVTPESVERFVEGMKIGLKATDLTVADTAYQLASVPLEKSYRIVNGLIRPNGAKYGAVTYMAISDKLYAIQCLAPVVDEEACQALAASFRLLH